MKLYVVNNVCHKDYYKTSDTSSKVISIHENKMDALIKSINYNFKEWGNFVENQGNVCDYYANDFMEIIDNEYHCISYEYSSDDFFWKVFDENIANLNFSLDKLEKIYEVTINCLTDSKYAEFTLSASYDLYEVIEVNDEFSSM